MSPSADHSIANNLSPASGASHDAADARETVRRVRPRPGVHRLGPRDCCCLLPPRNLHKRAAISFDPSPPKKRLVLRTGAAPCSNVSIPLVSVQSVSRMQRWTPNASIIHNTESQVPLYGKGSCDYLKAGGTLENALAAPESPRAAKHYDRTGNKITLDEVERIAS